MAKSPVEDLTIAQRLVYRAATSRAIGLGGFLGGVTISALATDAFGFAERGLLSSRGCPSWLAVPGILLAAFGLGTMLLPKTSYASIIEAYICYIVGALSADEFELAKADALNAQHRRSIERFLEFVETQKTHEIKVPIRAKLRAYMDELAPAMMLEYDEITPSTSADLPEIR